MNVKLTSVTGIDDAIVALHMSKRTWNQELDNHIREVYRNATVRHDVMEAKNELKSYMEKLAKWGQKHPTLLRFIDLSVTVEGLHRGGQDDWDSHARRFDNRIIRSSTRLADFAQNEKSDFYKNKILTVEEVADVCGITLPKEVWLNNFNYVKTVNGYIREDLAGSRDVKRGLYMLSIPSNFIFKVNLAEFAHVYRERNAATTAHPEVKEVAEEIALQLWKKWEYFTPEYLLGVKG